MRTFDLSSPTEAVEVYLKERNLLKSKERILTIDKPGEGNMNVVLRITTNSRSFILKQSRPYVQKYQQIEAPLERIAVENEFYQNCLSKELKVHMPKVLDFDTSENILLLEDLGACEDMTDLYQNKSIPENVSKKLVAILRLIHRKKAADDFPKNLKMRNLNHQHIFVLPFLKDNGFSLDTIQPGLQKLSQPYKEDDSLKSVIGGIGEKYLSQGETLLHGDYYPGSWITEAKNIYVIDPEFSFLGFKEFDLGVMAAHLIMATGNKKFIDKLKETYGIPIDERLLRQMAGTEIMRRLIGLAQLPLKRTIDEKRALLKTAHEMILA